MITATTVLFIIATIAGLATPVAQEIVSSIGNNKSSTLYKQAESISRRINKNQNLLEQLTDAYNRKDNNLMSSLLNSSGLGARAKSIKNEMSTNYKSYQNNKADISNKIAEDNTRYTKTINSAETAKTGTISGLTQANDVIQDNKNSLAANETNAAIQQNTNGGLQN